MEFGCSECSYRHEKKFCVKNHTKKKTKCGDNPQIIEIPIEIICDHCKKNYKTKPSLQRHYKSCKVLKSNREAKLIKENEELKEKIAKKPDVKLVHELKELKDKISKEDKNKFRSHARKIYKESGIKLVCMHCSHSRGVQICHIRELNSFNENDEDYGQINHPCNIIALCPNCHYDLDKKLLPDVVRTTKIYQRLMCNIIKT